MGDKTFLQNNVKVVSRQVNKYDHFCPDVAVFVRKSFHDF